MTTIIVKQNTYQYKPTNSKSEIPISGEVCVMQRSDKSTFTLKQIQFIKAISSGERAIYMRYEHNANPDLYVYVKIPIRNVVANTETNMVFQTMITDINDATGNTSVSVPIKRIIDSLQKIARYTEYKDESTGQTRVLIEYTPVFINITDSNDNVFKKNTEPSIKGKATPIANAQLFAEEQKQISCKQTTNSENKKNLPGRAIIRVVDENKTELLSETKKRIDDFKNTTIAFLFLFFLAVIGIGYYIIYHKPNTMNYIRLTSGFKGGKSRGK